MSDASSSGPKVISRKDFEARIVAQAWRDESYRKRLLANPKSIVQEELQNIEGGVQLPADLQVAVHEEAPDQYHLVIPRNPNDVVPGSVSPDQLEAIAPQTIAVVVVNSVAMQVNSQLVVITGPAVNVNVAQVVSQVQTFVTQVAAQVNTI
jgi:hypothetical protein